jgi:dTDP-4-amino-4,6-dideoxygalactose transaminase
VYAGANAGVSLAHAEEAARTVLSLPINPTLDEASIDRICTVIRKA